MIGSYRGAAFALVFGLTAGVAFSGCNSGTRETLPTTSSNTNTNTNTSSNTTTPSLTYTISIASVGSGEGTVTLSPAATNNTYPAGTVVTLTAVPTSGSTFLQWGGAAAGTTTFELQVALQGDYSLSPDFAAVDSGAPVGGFSINPDPAHVLAPATIAFTDSSANTPTGWLWDFGDGSVNDNTQNPSHTFSEPGQYTVSLRVSNANGNGTPAVKSKLIYIASRSEGSRFYYENNLYGNAIKQNDTNQAALALEVLNLVNAERAKVGVAAVSFDQQATNAAKVHSEDMMLRNYFSHVSPEGFVPADRLTAVKASGFGATGENIALGQTSAQQVMTSWMNSDGHRANILNPNFTHLGVGIANTSGGPYWTQVFLQR